MLAIKATKPRGYRCSPKLRATSLSARSLTRHWKRRLKRPGPDRFSAAVSTDRAGNSNLADFDRDANPDLANFIGNILNHGRGLGDFYTRAAGHLMRASNIFTA